MSPQRTFDFKAILICCALSVTVVAQDTSKPAVDKEFDARVAASGRVAAQRHPEIRDIKSRLYLRFRWEREWLSKFEPEFFKASDWPLILTERCAAALNEEELGRKKEDKRQPTKESPEVAPSVPSDELQPLSLEQMLQVVELYTKLQNLMNTQDQQSFEQDQRSLDMILQLQALKAGRSRSHVKQTPAEANAWWQQYRQKEKLNKMQAELDRLRQQHSQ